MKGGRAMKYERPIIVQLGTASGAIQGFGNKNPYQSPDADHQSSYLSTGHSYDLDE